MKRFSMHERNKNIMVESVDHGWPVRILKHLIRPFRPNFHQDPKIVFSERVVEYPLLFQHLKPEDRRILDFGCVEDLLPIHLASLGYEVTGLDFRPYPFAYRNFDFIQTDILSWDPPDEKFDAVISISTIEHVGLSAYGDPENDDGDKIAVAKLLHCLRRGGDLIITLPAGKCCIERGMRVYDRPAIEELVPNIKLLKLFYKPNRYGAWQETTQEVISKLTYDDYHTLLPAQGMAFIISEKP